VWVLKSPNMRPPAQRNAGGRYYVGRVGQRVVGPGGLTRGLATIVSSVSGEECDHSCCPWGWRLSGDESRRAGGGVDWVRRWACGPRATGSVRRRVVELHRVPSEPGDAVVGRTPTTSERSGSSAEPRLVPRLRHEPRPVG